MSSSLQYLHALAGGLRDWLTGRRGRGRQVLVWTLILAVVLRLSAPLILTRITNAALADGEKVRGSITGVSLGDNSGGAGSENVSLAFAKVDLEYRPQNPNGTLEPGIHFKFDIKANKDG